MLRRAPLLFCACVALLCAQVAAHAVDAAHVTPVSTDSDERQQSDSDERQQFVIAMNSAAVEFHPHRSFTVAEAQLFTAIYEGLVSYHPLTLAPQPAAAKRWTVSEDGRVYTFYLREDAKYWNGDPVTADHFRDAWVALLSPDADSYFSVLFDPIVGATEYRTGVTDDPTQIGLVVVSERVLRVTLSRPTPFFLSTLCHYSFSPIHPRMQQVADWNTSPQLLTNGPYVLTHTDKEEFKFTQSKNYWDYDSDNFRELRYLRIERENDAFMQFVNREIDWMISGLGSDLARYSRALHVNPILGTSFYFIMADDPPWSDARIRRALALAVPWGEVRSREHYIFPTSALVPPLPGYEQPAGIEDAGIGAAEASAGASTDEALRLLAEAGYPEGRGLPPLTISISDNNEDRRIMEVMATAWEGLNVEVVRTVVPTNEYFDYIETATDYTVGKISWIGDYVDPLAFLQLWSSDSNLNHAGYSNLEYDRLLQQAATQQGEERMDSLQSAERLIIDGALILPINHSVAINAIDTEQIRGWYVNILDIHPVKNIGRAPGFFLSDFVMLSTRRVE